MTPLHATLLHLQTLRARRAAGQPCALTTDPAWLVDMAINRRAGWPEDPSHQRGTCRPVHGAFPCKAGGDWYQHLRLIAREVNTPRLVVRVARLGEHRWLVRRLPGRFANGE